MRRPESMLEHDWLGSRQRRPVALREDATELCVDAAVTVGWDAEAALVVIPGTEDASHNARFNARVQGQNVHRQVGSRRKTADGNPVHVHIG